MSLRDYEIGVSSVFGKKIIDVAGYVTQEFGEDTLTFKITRIVFGDDSSVDIEGEHDYPYIANTEELQEIFGRYLKDGDC
jgi:hypothetical protein